MENLLRTLRQTQIQPPKQLTRTVARLSGRPQTYRRVHITTGMRHTGKTTQMMQQMQSLLNQGVSPEHFLHINFEDERLQTLTSETLNQLLEHFFAERSEAAATQKFYLFLDQIQHVSGWPHAIQQIGERFDVEVFLTTNSQSLSGEQTQWLSEQSLHTTLWPYDFVEFLQAKRVKVDPATPERERVQKARKLFMTYLQRGGFPDLIGYGENEQRRCLQRYVDGVMLRDLIEAHKISNTPVLRQLVRHVLQNVGQPFSINKFFNHIKSQGFAINRDRLYDYLAYMEDAYLCFAVPLHANSTRKVRVNGRIIYAIDPGLANAYAPDGTADLSVLFKNVVFLDLKRRGCEVCYYLTQARDRVDFLVTTSSGEQHLLQVVWDTHRPRATAKQMRALATASEELKVPGRVITLDRYLRDGIGV